jgi:hypothetical protein
MWRCQFDGHELVWDDLSLSPPRLSYLRTAVPLHTCRLTDLNLRFNCPVENTSEAVTHGSLERTKLDLDISELKIIKCSLGIAKHFGVLRWPGFQIRGRSQALADPKLAIHYSNPAGGRTASETHGRFDNDPATLTTVMSYILGKKTPFPPTEDELTGY